MGGSERDGDEKEAETGREWCVWGGGGGGGGGRGLD